MSIKKELSESDIRLRYIDPALAKSGWEYEQIRTEYSFTDGRVIVRGNTAKRGNKKAVDYLLSYKRNIPLAVIEAKKNTLSVGAGMQQALDYIEVLKAAKILDIPFAYSSNGDGFLEHDLINGGEREITLDEFPSPEALWQRYIDSKNIDKQQEKIISQPYYFDINNKDKIPRYYQRIAINRTIESIAKGDKRLLLVMATGTGKTYTAFQIIHRLWKSNTKKKILYLADRNILIDQTISNDFKPFEKSITKIERKMLDSSYEIYMSLYHQLSGDDNEEAFKQFKPEFFDLIIIDECHRGSAKEESRWRKILDYFSEATHIGLTATPKETANISNQNYFGEPIYTYSLKQGIEDGFLAPYKVIRIGLDKDLQGYRPEKGKIDIYGNEIEDREYNRIDYDKNLIIDDRTNKIAGKVTEFLKNTDRFSKTIVFCIDIDHAERMRQALVNHNSDLVKDNHKYVMRITGDNAEGKAQLDNFIDEESKYPTIVTTSKLMTTGVDCKICKLIVIDKNFGDGAEGMIEFKQIIGRGTRLKPEYDKLYFTIMDFREASKKFADPDFDGEPIQIYEPQEGDPIDDIDMDDTEAESVNNVLDMSSSGGGDYDFENDDGQPKRVKYRVNDVEVKIISERVQYYDSNGKLITESLTDYSKKNILNEFASLDDFLNAWNTEERKQAIVEALQEKGVLLEALREVAKNKELDDFDLICHIAYDKKPLTKAERANNVRKKDYLHKYSDVARDVLNILLDKYCNDNITEMTDTKLLELNEFVQFGSSLKIINAFGGKDEYIKAVQELQKELYTA